MTKYYNNIFDRNTLSINTTANTATLDVKGEGSTDSTKSLQIEDSGNNRVAEIYDNGSLFMGKGTSHDSSYPIHVQHPTGSGSRRGFKAENQDENAYGVYDSAIMNLVNNKDNIKISLNATPGGLGGGATEGTMSFNRISDGETIGRIRGRTTADGQVLDFEESEKFRFATQGNNTANNPTFEIDSNNVQVARLGQADSSTKTYDSSLLTFESTYFDGSLQAISNTIQRIQEATGTTEGRLQLTGPSASNLDINFDDDAKVGIQTQTPNSTLDVNGSFGAAILSADTSYTATTSNRTLLGDASNGAITFTLPAPSDVERIEFDIKKIDGTSSNVNIEAADGSKLDGDTIQTIGKQYNAITAKAYGGQYWLF